MKRVSAASAGYVARRALDSIGRARRFALDDEGPVTRELWVLPLSDEALAERLVGLDVSFVGGFADAGVGGAEGAEGASSVWLVRRLGQRTLAAAMRVQKKPWSPRETVALGRDIAIGLAALERLSLSLGPLSPDGVTLVECSAHVVAEELVTALVGGVTEGRGSALSAASPRYTPPAQANGEPWDAAANRYVLGLMLYRLLSGSHPFSGAGLRHALDEAAHREAPPFEEALALAMPPGLLERVVGQHMQVQSTLMFACRTIDPYRSSCFFRKSAKSSGAKNAGSSPRARNRSLVSGDSIIRRLSDASRSRVSRETPAGARKPIHARISNPGRLADSAIVGIPGRAIAGRALETASALRRPALTCGATVAVVSNV